MSAIFEARYHSECPGCGWRVKPGDMVRYNDHDEVVHVSCPEDTGLRAVGEICPKCFIERATNGACGCEP